MCIIAICNTRKLTDKEFENCWKGNDHGVGMAYHENNKVYYRKGLMTLETAKEAYNTITVLPHIVHFRIRSAGGVSESLTHPFIITESSPIQLAYSGKNPILFHNGTISGWKEMPTTLSIINGKFPDGEISDSRVIAMMVARVGEKILQWQGDKFVILTPKVIKTFGDFIEEDGIEFSNAGYKHTFSAYGVTYKLFYDDEDNNKKGKKPKKNYTGKREYKFDHNGCLVCDIDE